MATSITKFTRPSVLSLLDDLKPALERLAEPLGLDVKIGRATYSETTAGLRIEFFVAGGSEAKAVEQFAMRCDRYGLTTDDYGRTLTHDGQLYRIFAITAHSSNRPIICEHLDTGNPFHFPIKLVLRLLGRGTAATSGSAA
jgi:hypothetical protein